MVFYTLVLQFYFRKWTKKDDTFLRKKAEDNPNIATIIISVDGKTTAFQLKLKL